MSDERLRELERCWQETKSLEAEAAWLRGRVRAGDLGEDKLRLASFLGHHAALVAAGGVPETLPDSAESSDALVTVVSGLAAWGPEVVFRAGMAIASVVAHHWKHDLPTDTRFQEAYEAALAWLHSPSLLAAAEAIRLANRLHWGPAAGTCMYELGRSIEPGEGVSIRQEKIVKMLMVARLLSAPEKLLHAIRTTVSDWALGYEGALPSSSSTDPRA